MKSLHSLGISMCVGVLLTSPSTSTHAAIDAGAETVRLQSSCVVAGSTLDNCFESTTALMSWVNDTRQPQASTPLAVEIGPGTFTPGIMPNCSTGATGHISFRGVGRDLTKIDGAGSAAFVNSFCTNLNFSNMTFINGAHWVALWMGNGTSTWNSVNIEQPDAQKTYVWEDTGGTHYWFSSRINGAKKGYFSTRGESWFFGSEIASTGKALIADRAEIHAYGGVIRAIRNTGAPAPVPEGGIFDDGLVAVTSIQADVHIHGTGIDVIHNVDGGNIGALVATNNGKIHANQSSYSLSVGTGGNIYRIIDTGGLVTAPYVWGQNPEAPDVISVSGSDQAVVTNTADNQPHIVVYSNNCPSNWFDVVTATCR